MKYIKKPIAIEAIQLQENDLSIRACLVFMGQEVTTDSNIACDKFGDYCNIVRDDGGIYIKTLESDSETQLASIGDFIIKGVRGEFYPCKPDIFIETYDKVEE